ncbi:MAG: phenylalanine--tRNA ligase subunit beta [Blastocatellia bacterium]|nr:MAG: phenylalanine--tRNA ligase subunit beta [Blastocatellia bacterium]
MRLLVSWLRDFVDVRATAQEIADGLELRGFEVAAIEPCAGGDAVIDFEVTANRPDCLSVIGLAREVATLFRLPMTTPSSAPNAKVALKTVTIGESEHLKVAIADEDLCPRYAAAIAAVNVSAIGGVGIQSPSWMVARLQAAGLRSITPIVDITNYALVELGHPTHAFDLKRLAGRQLNVRRATSDETIITLDNIERRLEPDTLVIADRDRAQAVAGVMGGAAAEVSAESTLVAFESAYFKPASVRRTSKRLGLKTEASSRFERGADIEAPVVALQRIGALMDQIGAGHFLGSVIDVYPTRREPSRVHMRRTRLTRLLGTPVPDDDVERILRGLGFSVRGTSDGWDVIAPTFRVDIMREPDLIEEVGRHYGFDKLPATFPVLTTATAAPDPRVARDQLVRRVLTAAGLSEAVTFGFIEARAAEPFIGADGSRPVSIANPLSAKFDTLRPLIVPGLVDAVAHNRRHGRDDVGLFEIGTRFSFRGENRAVAVAWTGSAAPVHWSTRPRPVDFFDVKGVIERLCEALAVPISVKSTDEPFLVNGLRASVVAADGRPLGVIGNLLPAIADARGLPRLDPVLVAELDLDALAVTSTLVFETVKALPRYPLVVRDLSIVVADTLPAEIIRGTIQTAGTDTPAPLVDVTFFDRYQGKGIPDGSLSLAVRLTFQAKNRTLTDAEVQQSVGNILATLMREHGAVQR